MALPLLGTLSGTELAGLGVGGGDQDKTPAKSAATEALCNLVVLSLALAWRRQPLCRQPCPRPVTCASSPVPSSPSVQVSPAAPKSPSFHICLSLPASAVPCLIFSATFSVSTAQSYTNTAVGTVSVNLSDISQDRT